MTVIGKNKLLDKFVLPPPHLLYSPHVDALEESIEAIGLWGTAVQTKIAGWLATDPVVTRNFGPLTWTELHHELTPFYMEAASVAVLPVKSTAEFNAINSAKLPTVTDVFRGQANFLDFKATLQSICLALGVDSRIRDHGVKTVTDKSGASVIYPHHTQVDSQLAELFEFLAGNFKNFPHLCAVAAHLGIGHIHPLSDGNGRLSRAVYNWMINAAGAVKFYLPLHELAALSDGGYIIRFRKATYQNDWSEIVVFFTRLITAFKDWGAGSSGKS